MPVQAAEVDRVGGPVEAVGCEVAGEVQVERLLVAGVEVRLDVVPARRRAGVAEPRRLDVDLFGVVSVSELPGDDAGVVRFGVCLEHEFVAPVAQ